jgi:thiamine-phosphate pyrophosphorylase
LRRDSLGFGAAIEHNVTNATQHCGLYAVVEAGPGASERLAAALAAGDIAVALIVPGAGATLDAGGAKPLVDMAQRADTAALLADNWDLAHALRADGVHLTSAPGIAASYAQAPHALGAGGIVGVDAGISRHDAMSLAEAGADYIAFAAPARLKERDKARMRRNELVAWWGEIFEVPCVAFDVENADEAEALCRAGADFVAVTLAAAQPPAAAHDLIAAVASLLRAPQGAD